MTDETKPRVVLPYEEGSLSEVELPTPVRFCLGKHNQYVDVKFERYPDEILLELMASDTIEIQPRSGNVIAIRVRDPLKELKS